jgi:hypothetical protein
MPDDTQIQPHKHMPLYIHVSHPHKPRNAAVLHKQEQQASGLNAKVAVGLTRIVGTMWTAYSFSILAVVGLLAILGILNPLTAILVAWTSQTLIQLTLLPIIMVGQNVLSRKAELQADEMFATTQHSFHDIEQVMNHLDKQDEKIQELEARILQKEEEILTLLKVHQGTTITTGTVMDRSQEKPPVKKNGGKAV